MAMTDLPARLRALQARISVWTQDGANGHRALDLLSIVKKDLDALLGALETDMEPTRDELKQALTDLLVKCSCQFGDCDYHNRARNLLGLSHDPDIARQQAAGAVGRAAPPDGWQQEQSQMKLDAKFYGTIIKAKDATTVPDDEYVVFLAKDNAFADVLPLYIRACIERKCDPEQIDAAQAMYDRLCRWRAAHPERLKDPDAKGERLLAPVTERRAP